MGGPKAAKIQLTLTNQSSPKLINHLTLPMSHCTLLTIELAELIHHPNNYLIVSWNQSTSSGFQ